MKDTIILVGGGGHCKACLDVVEQEARFAIGGIVDIREKIGQQVCGYPIIACDDDLPELSKEYQYFLITVGQIKSPAKRVQLFNTLSQMNITLPVIQSPYAYVSKHSSIGAGSIVMHGVIVNAGATVGKNCILNTGSIIEHDAIIGDHCHVSTHCVVNGCVQIEEQSFLGSNAMIRNNIHIGSHTVVGASLKIMQNLPAHSFIK